MTSAGPLIALTGGPGTGKTALLDALAARGFATVPEAGRGVIQDQLAVDGPALPWRDSVLFSELMLAETVRAHRRTAPRGKPVFFDRGVLDVYAYRQLLGVPPSAHLRRAAAELRYDSRVFLTPMWPDIYVRDAERRQTYEEAVRTQDACVAAYEEHGYELLWLPLAPVAERVDSVLSTLNPPAG